VRISISQAQLLTGCACHVAQMYPWRWAPSIVHAATSKSLGNDSPPPPLRLRNQWELRSCAPSECCGRPRRGTPSPAWRNRSRMNGKASLILGRRGHPNRKPQVAGRRRREPHLCRGGAWAFIVIAAGRSQSGKDFPSASRLDRGSGHDLDHSRVAQPHLARRLFFPNHGASSKARTIGPLPSGRRTPA
jgi:hypothetical protein